MNTAPSQIRRWLLGLAPEETRYQKRGFRGASAAARARLESIGTAFLSGYHAALDRGGPEGLAVPLERVDRDLQGFAYEGAAMGLALLDWLTPWRRDRIATFLQGAGDAHAYMVHVGIGWVWARVPANVPRALAGLDPVLRWLAVDGYGFHEAFFHWPAYLPDRAAPKGLAGYASRAFDQGFGRCLWFVNGANVELVARTIAGFAPARQADLWSGIGLAATYAGGVGEAQLDQLRAHAGRFQPQLAQGSAFAAKARLRADNVSEHTALATRLLCDRSPEQAARVTDDAREHLPDDTAEPAFEIWRQRVQDRCRQSQPLPPT